MTSDRHNQPLKGKPIMLRIPTVLLIAIADLFSGCASTTQARNVQPSDFLDECHSLLQAGPKDRMLWTYRNPTTDWAAYNKVQLKPVTIGEDLSSKLLLRERHDLLVLAGSLEDMLYLKLSQDYEMTESSTAETLLIQVAITPREERSTAPALWSSVAQELQAVATIYTLAGKPPFSGEITSEFTIRDAQTSGLLAAGADLLVGRQQRIDREAVNSGDSVKNGLEFLADLSAYRLCVLRGASVCVEPKV
jgi:hypothetical protein